MNLTIDIGNTISKFAVFKDKVLLIRDFIDGEPGEAFFKNIQNTYPGLRNSIISSVKHVDPQLINLLRKKFNLLELTPSTPLPVKKLYAAPETLGQDRLAGVIGATGHFPASNILSIDAGTCITYDFINDRNEYIGGAISPGLKMRFRALNNFTAKLPLAEPDDNYNSLIGITTETSILSGVQHGTLAEIEGIIDRYASSYENLKILLTGGDSDFFVKRLKKTIFVAPNLVLEGLNEILEYNVQK